MGRGSGGAGRCGKSRGDRGGMAGHVMKLTHNAVAVGIGVLPNISNIGHHDRLDRMSN